MPPKNNNGGRSTQRRAPSRAVSFNAGIEDNDDQIRDPDEEDDQEEEKQIVKQIQQKHTAKQKAALNAEKNAMYETARERAALLVKEGTTIARNAIDAVEEIGRKMIPYEVMIKQALALQSENEETFERLVESFPFLIDTLSPLRVDKVTEASQFGQDLPASRERDLRRQIKNANLVVDTAKEEKKVATEAVELLQRYENLLAEPKRRGQRV